MPAIRFIYFDLGNVLLGFSHQLAAQQMAQVARCDYATVWDVVFGAQGLEFEYETGLISTEQFFQEFCERTNTQPNYDDFIWAGSAIFRPLYGTIALAYRLHAAGYPLGVLSNTCPSHWEFCMRNYSFISKIFQVYCLSFQYGCMKPHAAIYDYAAQLVGVESDAIFFCDDRRENVEAAIDSGFDARLFVSPSQLARDLMTRNIYFNF
jgi:putative hydrolase of the HAD superfamily